MRKAKSVMKGLVLVALALGALAVQSCGKKDSLVVVGLTTPTANTTLRTVTIGVGGVTRTFDIPAAGLSDTPTQFGVYVSQTGMSLFVGATATDANGKGCYSGVTTVDIPSLDTTVSAQIELRSAKTCMMPTGQGGSGGGSAGAGAGGETGAGGDMGAAGMAGAGGDMGAAGMAGAGGDMGGAGMTGAGGMAGAGGMGGMGGAAGTGMAGTTGTGGMIQIVAPPSLTKCTEYLHIDALSCTGTSTNSDTLVWDLAFSPDGTLLATAADDGRVKIWKMNGSVPTPEGHVLSSTLQAYVAFSPDGKWLAVGSGFGDFALYDGKTFQPKGTLTGHDDDIEGVAFSPDSKHVWSIDLSGVLTRHDIGGGTAPGTTVTTGFTGFTLAVSPVFTATDQWLAIGFDDGSGDIANMLPGMTAIPTTISVSKDTYGVYGMSFSADGKTLVAGGHDGIVSFWDIPPPSTGASSGATLSLLDSANKPEAVKAVKYSPDGKYVAVAAGDPVGSWKIGIFNAATRKAQATKIPTYTPLSIAWSPSGGIVAAGEDTCGKILICSDN
jgi:hypothetical protein